MKLNTAYIIHHLPDDPEQRRLRKAAHAEQIAYWRQFGLKFCITASNVRGEDLDRGSDIRYIQIQKGVGQANSRNILLREFYASDEDFGLFMDDDIILDDTAGSSSVFEELLTVDINRMHGIDLFSPIHPEWHGWDAAWKANNGGAAWTFKRNPRQAGHSMFIRNMRKFYDREYYFKNEWSPQPWAERCGEDVVFALDLHMDRFGVYDCYNMLKVVELDDNSTWMADSSKRHKLVDEFNARLVEEYDLPIKSGCEIDWAQVAEMHTLTKTR